MQQQKSYQSISFLFLFLLNMAYMISASQPYLKFEKDHVLKFSFGSCNKFYQTDDSSIFYKVAEYNPDLYAWIGDAAYIENMETYYLEFSFPGPEIARARLENTKNDPPYVKLRENTPVIGVWDNHDYGKDLGGQEFQHKDAMQQIYLDFVDEPKDSARRKRKGIYEKYDINIGELSIQIILLDVRYHKNEETGDILGDEQWIWLEKAFEENKDLYLIASGSQILPEDRILHEIWFPKSSRRLINLIREKNVSAILLSGDVHDAEIMRLPCSEDLLGYQLIELTSSGLTHTTRDHFPMGHVAHKLFFPQTYNKPEDLFVDWNFGIVEITPDPSNLYQSIIDLQIRDRNGKIVLQTKIKLGDLKRKSEPKTSLKSYGESLCFNSTREERFYNHLKFILFDPEVMIFVGTPLLGIITILMAVCWCLKYILCRSSSRKSKAKHE